MCDYIRANVLQIYVHVKQNALVDLIKTLTYQYIDDRSQACFRENFTLI